MNLTDRDRKLLWTRAGNRCSFRLEQEVCGQPLTQDQGGASVVVGEECHIVGENPGSARYLEEYPDRETYSNAILLCGTHHKLIDDERTRRNFPAGLLRSMKAIHEQAVAQPDAPTLLRDSKFSVTAEDADLAVALDITSPATLSGVQAKLTAKNVREAYGARVGGSLVATLSVCEVCGSPVPAVGVGGPPQELRCPRCGHTKQLR